MSIVRLKSLDGADIAFDDSVIIGAGGMKDVYFAPDKSYVVGFFRNKQEYVTKERLQLITGRYREGILNGAGGEFWKSVYCWPTHVVEHNGKLGVVAPTYAKHFFFQHGSQSNDSFNIKGKEKEGKWFASALHQGQSLDPRERGHWLSYLRISLNIARAVRRMHIAGLAHSDLSYKNVLVDPVTGSANIIDIDGLVVPGKFPPDVIGTPDFVAPEVMRTMKMKPGDPGKALPRRETDQHALAVLIYMYLLYRHPLRGRKIWDPDDSALDEELAMGEKALFVEHDQDSSNRPTRKWLEANYGAKKLGVITPYMDPDALPYTVLGPYLTGLFKRSFIDGLHAPAQRPGADEYETALVKTADLVLNCANPDCCQKYFVYDNSLKPVCPFCKASYGKSVPVFDLYQNRGGGRFTADNHRLVGYHNQYIFKWHMNANVWPNEKLAESDRKPVGYISWHNNKWMLVNQAMPALKDVKAGKLIAIGQGVELVGGLQLLLDNQVGGRLVNVQVAG
jgi:serine/threonine protein kinase